MSIYTYMERRALPSPPYSRYAGNQLLRFSLLFGFFALVALPFALPSPSSSRCTTPARPPYLLASKEEEDSSVLPSCHAWDQTRKGPLEPTLFSRIQKGRVKHLCDPSSSPGEVRKDGCAPLLHVFELQEENEEGGE